MCVKTEKEFRKFTNPSLSWRHSTTNSLTDILTEYSSTLCLSMCMHPYAIPMSQWHYSDVSKFPISAQQEVNTSMVLRTNKPKRFISMMGTIFYICLERRCFLNVTSDHIFVLTCCLRGILVWHLVFFHFYTIIKTP